MHREVPGQARDSDAWASARKRTGRLEHGEDQCIPPGREVGRGCAGAFGLDALDQCGARLRLATFAEKKGKDASKPTVDRDSVTTTVSQWTGIPLERLSGEETGDLLELEERLRARVLGQNRACRAVARAVITAKAGLSDPDRPTGSERPGEAR